MNTLVYLKPITNLSDGRFAAAAGCSFTGFVCDPIMPNSINMEAIIQIAGWLSGPESIAIFGRPTLHLVEDTCERLQINIAEVPYLANVNWAQFKVRLMVTLPISMVFNPEFNLNEFPANSMLCLQADEIITDFTQLQAKHQMLKTLTLLSTMKQIFVELPWTTTSLQAFSKMVPFAGVVFKGGYEERPGLRSFDDLTDLLEVLDV